MKSSLIILSLVLLLIPSSAYALQGLPTGGTLGNQWIVVLDDDCSLDMINALTARITTTNIYENVFRGFSYSGSQSVVDEFYDNNCIKSMTQDVRIYITDDGDPLESEVVPFGITRMESQRINQNYTSTANIVIMDTGLINDHPDLNVVGGFDFTGSDNGNPEYSTWRDGHGHGTHTGGTAAAIDNEIGVTGVSPGAPLTAMKVLSNSGSGSFSDVIKAMDFLFLHADEYDVVNQSFGGSTQTDFSQQNCDNTEDAMYIAYCKVASAGVVIVVAAGNSNRDSALHIPAAFDDAVITVSAVDPRNSQFASFSNDGEIVDIAASGVNTLSTVPATGSSCCSDITMYKHLSGTSMATPHVTGWVGEYVVAQGKPLNYEDVLEVRSVMRTSGFAQDGDKGFTGDTDGFLEPYLNGNTDFTRPDIHDLEASAIILPTESGLGGIVNMTITITNIGTFTDSAIYTLTNGNTTFNGNTGELAKNEKLRNTIEWNTEGIERGQYTWTLTISEDENPDNNKITKSTVVIAMGDRDIAITGFRLLSQGVSMNEIAFWELGNLQTVIANEGIVVIDTRPRIDWTDSSDRGVRKILGAASSINNMEPGTSHTRGANMIVFDTGDITRIGNYTLHADITPNPLSFENDTADNSATIDIVLTNGTDRELPPYHGGNGYTQLDIFKEHIIDPFADRNGRITAGDPNGDMNRTSIVVTTLDRIPDEVTFEIVGDKFKISSTAIGVQTLFLYWHVFDDEGNKSNTTYSYFRFVDAEPPIDTVPPVLTLRGESPMTIIKDSVYRESGASCLDFHDGQIDDRVIRSGEVDESIIATYNLTYNCSDTSGNDAEPVVRVVHVVADPNPPQDPPSDIVQQIRVHLAAIDILLNSVGGDDGFEDKYNDEVLAHNVTKGELVVVTEERNIAVNLLNSIRTLLANLFN